MSRWSGNRREVIVHDDRAWQGFLETFGEACVSVNNSTPLQRALKPPPF
jgi:hypothetical protein